jgi:hypothetical protein
MSTSSSLQVLAIMILSMDMYAINHLGMVIHAYIRKVHDKVWVRADMPSPTRSYKFPYCMNLKID